MKKISKTFIYIQIVYGWLVFMIAGLVASIFGLQYDPVVLFLSGILFYITVVSITYMLLSHYGLRALGVLFSLIGGAILPILFFCTANKIPTVDSFPCGYLRMCEGESWYAGYTYAESYALFIRPFEWDAYHDIKMLEHTHKTQFTLVEDSPGMVRYYRPEEHPELKVRIYSYNKAGTDDDYMHRIISGITLEYIEDHKVDLDYKMGNRYEGQVVFLIYEHEDIEQYADGISEIITKAMDDSFFLKHRGEICVELGDGQVKELYFGMESGSGEIKHPEAKDIRLALEEKTVR